MATRVFIHVGTPKSGTTFLQSVWWANKPGLRDQGLLLPGRGINSHYWASCVVRGGHQLDHLPPAGLEAWTRLLRRTADFEGDALISHELFSAAEPDHVAGALRDLEGVADQVHVMLTARDLVRQIPAEWQQRTKHGHSQRLDEFIERIRDDPSMNFWRVQDVPAILDRWSVGIPADRVHLIVLPPPGGSSSTLWTQVCEVTGVDGTGMDQRASRRNESLGLAEAEVMRRVSGELNQGGLAKSTERLLKNWFAENMLRSTDPEKIVLPPAAYPWVLERVARMVDEIAQRDHHVVGDLSDLVPRAEPTPGRDLAQLAEEEVSAVAIRALARFVEHEEETRQEARAAAARERAEIAPGPGAGAAEGEATRRGLRARLRPRR